MKTFKGIVVLWVVLCSQSTLNAKTLDPFWMYHDVGNGIYLIYQYFLGHDTLRAMDMYDYYPTDTGDKYDGEYLKFDYQFSADTQYYRDEFDSTIVKWKGKRPGYAGFKAMWDYGMTGFPVARYKNIVLAHKGPLPNHKVSIWFWYNNGGCGTPSFKEYIGSINASATWKLDTIPVPESVQDKPDSMRNYKYYEMVFLINNRDPNDTNTRSAKGCFAIDNMELVGRNPIDTSPKSRKVTQGQAAQFRVVTSTLNPDDELAYQWKKNWKDIPGAYGPTFTIASAAPEDSGAYTVSVTTGITGLVFTSQKATLTIMGTVINRPATQAKAASLYSIFATGSEIVVNYAAKFETPIRIALYNVDGRKLMETFSGTLDPGQRVITWQPKDAGNAGAGVGIAKVKIGQVELSQRIVHYR